MAFAAVAALVAGEAATTALVLSAVAEIGVTMSVVGAVTGNKSLMKIGGVLGLVGGVGGFLAGAGSAAGGVAAETAGGGLAEGATNAALDTASQEAMGAYGGASEAASVTDGVVSGMEGAASGAADAAGTNTFANIVDDAAKSASSITDSTAGSSASSVTDAAAKTPGATTNTMDVATTQQPKALIGEQPAAQSPPTSGDGFTPSNVPLDPMGNVALPESGAKDYWGKFMGWVKNNQTVANGILKLGGEALNGMSQRDMFDKKLAQQNQQFQTQYGHANEVASYAFKPLIGARP